MKRLLPVLLVLGACADRDLCQGHDGTCLGIRVRGEGQLTQVDQLHVEVLAPDGDATKTLRVDLPVSPSSLATLPIASAVYLDSTVLGATTIFVQGRANGRVIGGGEATIQVEAGGHYELETTLSPSPAGGVACPDAGTMIFCDDFEQDSGNMFPTWATKTAEINLNPVSDVITVVTDKTEVFRGAQSLLVTASGGDYGQLDHSFGTGVMTSTVAMRAYVYLGEVQGSAALLALRVADASYEFGLGPSGPSAHDEGYWQIVHNGAVAAYGPRAQVGVWTCVEVVVGPSPAALYATDAFAPVPNAPPVVQSSLVPPLIGGVYLGLIGVSGGMAQAWFDDFAVATQRIGCE